MENIENKRGQALAEPLLSHSIDNTEPELIERETNSLYFTREYSKSEKHNNSTHSVKLKHRKLEKRLVAELQIETLSTPCARLFLYSWYAMLILALIIQSFVSLEWEITNICGASKESLQDLNKWNSPCVESYSYFSSGIDWPKYAINNHIHAVPIDVLYGSKLNSTYDLKEYEKYNNNNNNNKNNYYSIMRRMYNLRWVGNNHGSVLDIKLNRFIHIVVSMASPQENIPEEMKEKRYPLMFALEESPLSSSDDSSDSSNSNDIDSSSSISISPSISISSTDISPPINIYFYNTTTVCSRTEPRCSSVVLPQEVVVATNRSRITLTIFGVEEELKNVSASSAIGISFQRSAYTIGTIVWRYTFLLFSILHLIRFVYRKRFSKTLYEQYWVMLLHLGLYLYLDPIFAAGIYKNNGMTIYHFFEFRIPNYFAALLSCFIFALITASINWSEGKEEMESLEKKTLIFERENTETPSLAISPRPSTTLRLFNPNLTEINHQQEEEEKEKKQKEEEKEKEKQEEYSPKDLSNITSFTNRDEVRPIGATRSGIPLWAKMIIANYFIAVICLDIAWAYVENWDWGTGIACTKFSCLYIKYTLYALLLLFIIVCCVMLVRLHRNLGNRSYLETRPQQLACRVFIFVFSTAFMYFVIQVILIALLYPQIIGIVSYQPFTQLSPLMVATFFVNHITFIYTTTIASRRVPIRPDNPKWRRVIWSSEWYRWLDLHGGILYIFYNEKQERYFNWLQNKKELSIQHRQKMKHNSNTKKKIENNGKDGMKDNSGDEREYKQDVGDNDANYSNREIEEVKKTVNEEEEDIFSSSISSYDSNNSSDNDDETMISNSKKKTITPKLSVGKRARSGVLNFLEKAERRLIDRPANLIDCLEEALVDPLQSLLLPKNSRRMPFFNLETAIDCLNLSWEAYVEAGDKEVNIANENENENSGFFSINILKYLKHRWFSYFSSWCSSFNCIFFSCCCQAEDSNIANDEVDSNIVIEKINTSHPETTINTEVTENLSPLSEVLKPKMSTEKYGYNQIAVFEGRDVQVVLTVMNTSLPCHHRKLPRIIIAFRGTDNLSNAREDLRFRQRIWREVDSQRQWGIAQSAKVHTGFLNIWISLKESVLQTLREYIESHPNIMFSIFCTGHSLGGALACLCAFSVRRMLRLMKYPITELTVYTFGQPPLGNKAFQSAYNRAIPRTFRVVNESDAISLIDMYGYHVGIEVDIDRQGSYICKPMFIERLFRPTRGKGFAVTNHSLAAYAESLNAVARKNSHGACKVSCLKSYVQELDNSE